MVTVKVCNLGSGANVWAMICSRLSSGHQVCRSGRGHTVTWSLSKNPRFEEFPVALSGHRRLVSIHPSSPFSLAVHLERLSKDGVPPEVLAGTVGANASGLC